MMKLLWILWILGAALGALSSAAPAPEEGVAHEISIKSDQQISTEPLTTDRVIQLDPLQPNPHRQRWALGREVEAVGLKAVPIAGGRFGVDVEALRLKTIGYLRAAPGPWYLDWSRYPCDSRGDAPAVAGESWFSTPEGARAGALAAEKLWQDLVERERITLEVQLKHVTGATESLAVRFAKKVIVGWMDALNVLWRAEALPEARRAELEFYREGARERGLCAGKAKATAKTAIRWIDLMEPVNPSAAPALLDGGPTPALLARAPVRLWDGLFTIRAEVIVGGRSLSGRFLVDTGAPRSILSPAWLNGEGVLPELIEVPGTPHERARWSSPLVDETTREHPVSAATVAVDDFKIAGVSMPLTEFLVHSTAFFGVPEHLTGCCDGVLGNDLLGRYVVHFAQNKPTELRFWDPQGFQLGGIGWTELSIGADGRLTSPCTLDEVHPVAWETGDSELARAPERARENGRLSCDSPAGVKKLSENLHVIAAPKAGEAIFGMQWLDRGDFVLDLPHGRLWFLDPPRFNRPLPENRSGLRARFGFPHGDRALVVTGLDRASPAAALAHAGLKPGMVIQQINGREASELDLWEVNRILAGVHGKSVSLSWKQGARTKLAPINLP